jgi:hypothetical protein
MPQFFLLLIFRIARRVLLLDVIWSQRHRWIFRACTSHVLFLVISSHELLAARKLVCVTSIACCDEIKQRPDACALASYYVTVSLAVTKLSDGINGQKR